jgi:putative endonuclease
LTKYGFAGPFIKINHLKVMRSMSKNPLKSSKTVSSLHKRGNGNIGENIACEFLCKRGFAITDRNYLKRWGELDIVAKKDINKDGEVHFFEVKSVTEDLRGKFSDIHRAEDNVDGWKMRKLRRIIETYLSEKGSYGLETPFQFHVLCVYMDMKTHRARVRWLENIIL